MFMRLFAPRRSLWLFSIWLLIGAAAGFVAMRTFSPVTLASAQPDVSQSDPDIHPVLDVVHTPPVILRSDEMAHLEFLFTCDYFKEPGSCKPSATLYATWGSKASGPIELAYTDIATIDLPASEDGQGLQYYIELQDVSAGIGIRYPVEGFIQPTVASSFVNVDASMPKPINPRILLHLPWGSGEGEVGLLVGNEGPTIGPDAFDVGPDGQVAILDEANRRIILTDSTSGLTSNIPIPSHGAGDVDIDMTGQIAFLDIAGVVDANSHVRIPQLYHFSSDGRLIAQAPVFARLPSELMGTQTILDRGSIHSLMPFDGQGNARSRDDQRASRRRPELQSQFIDAQHTRLADTAQHLVFEVSSDEELGAIPLFESVTKEYIVVFQAPNIFRIVRFNRNGQVLQNVSVSASGAEWANPSAQVAVDDHGSVYILNSTPSGLEILRVEVVS